MPLGLKEPQVRRMFKTNMSFLKTPPPSYMSLKNFFFTKGIQGGLNHFFPSFTASFSTSTQHPHKSHFEPQSIPAASRNNDQPTMSDSQR